MVYTRAQWQQRRDAAGIKAGLVKGVDVGPMLDAYHKAGAGKTGTGAWLAQVKTVTPLINGLKKYKTALPQGNALIAVVDEMIDSLQQQVDLGAKLANPVTNVSNYLRKTITDAKAVVASGDGTAYQKLWKEDVRGVGTGLGKVKTLDPGLTHIHEIWLPYTTGDWDYTGITKGITDAAAKKAKTQAKAKEILGLATKVQSELKAAHVIS